MGGSVVTWALPGRLTCRIATTVCLIAATALAAFGAAACSSSASRVGSPSAAQAPPATSVALGPPPGAVLPGPEALTGVLARLADPNVPSGDKAPLIEGATPDTAATLDKFINALRDNGYLPLGFAATNVAWSDTAPTHVIATVAVTTAQPSHPNFTFPMEFTPCPPAQGGWQLSRRTATMLLAMSPSSAAPAPGPPPPPPPPPH